MRKIVPAVSICGTKKIALNTCSFKKRIDKLFAVERLKIGHFLAEADVLDWYFQLVRDAYYYAAFGCTVELGDG